MTKREKILLQICIAIGLVGLGSVYLLRPSINEKKAQQEALELVQLEELQINAVLDAEGLDERLEEQKKLADENYRYFYDKLNSYTIDEILNERIASCGLEVESMSIGEYSEIGEEELMLGCQVLLSLQGTYSEVLAFVDALREESTCIEVTAVNLYANERNVEEEEAVTASLGLLIYGVSDAMLEEGAQ